MDFLSYFGPWAIVTGASSGLGKEFCKQLAERGLNLVLVARSIGKLENLSDQLKADYGVKTRILSLDLSDPGNVDVLYFRTIDLDVGLLVSNAGDINIGRFANQDYAEVRKNVQLNVTTHTELAHYVSNRIHQTRRGRGGLMFISSIMGLQAVPYLSVYSAASSYITSLGEALHYENRKKGLHVCVVAPGVMDTPMVNQYLNTNKFSSSGLIPILPVRPVVKGALRKLEKNKTLYIPGWRNRWLVGFYFRRLLSRGTNLSFWAAILKHSMKCMIRPGISLPSKEPENS